MTSHRMLSCLAVYFPIYYYDLAVFLFPDGQSLTELPGLFASGHAFHIVFLTC